MEGVAQAERTTDVEQFDRYLRVYNDTTTWLAETLDGSMRTPFEYQYDGHDLVAEDGSRLRPIFEDALVDGRRLVQRHPNLAFEIRRRQHELDEYADMMAMVKHALPNTMVVVSDFPPELMDASSDVGGYNVSRKQTMLRVITYQNGSIKMFSQSLDGSDRQALQAMYASVDAPAEAGELLGQRRHLQLEPEQQELLLDKLVGVYDRTMQAQYGGSWYAGRPEATHDTYDFVRQQSQLVDYLVETELAGVASDVERYNVAALMYENYERRKRLSPTERRATTSLDLGSYVTTLEVELLNAGRRAVQQGRQFSGCGSSLAGGNGELGGAANELDQAGYGGSSDEETAYKFDKKMYCVDCQAPPEKEEKPKWCGPCGLCRSCDKKHGGKG